MPNVIATSAVFTVSGPPPSAVNDAFTVAGGASVDLDVLGNDLYLTSHAISDLTQPAGGNVTSIINNGTGSAKIKFVAINPASTTGYTFQYRVDNSAGLATVSVSVTHTATVVAVDDSFGPFAAGSTNDLPVLNNDTVTNRAIAGLTQPSAGTTSIINNTLANAMIRFVAPSPGVITDYTFQYTVDGSAPATVTATVNAAGATAGLQFDLGSYQQISDAVPAGAVWWNPTSGNDSNDGSTKALAKKTFTSAETAAAVGKRIILAGGAAGSTTYHAITSAVKPTKSGSSTSARMELFAEPGCKVVLCRDVNFLPILTKSATWSAIGSGIYECSLGSFGDGATTITTVSGDNSTLGNPIYGILEIPNGPMGKTHFQMLIPVSQAIMERSSSNGTNSAGYPGPCICFLSNGKIRVRLTPPTSAYAGTEWPTDGIMGGLIGSNGAWAQPSGAPGSYRLHVFRTSCDNGTAKTTEGFDFTNNVSWWHIKGINTDLCTGAISLGTNTGLWFERMTRISIGHDIINEGSQHHTIVNDYCQAITGSVGCFSWQEHKSAGGKWTAHFRSASFFAHATITTDSDCTWNNCVLYGWYDFTYINTGSPLPCVHKYHHCAILMTLDDGWSQDGLGGPGEIEFDSCFVFGGPFVSGGAGSPDSGTAELYMHDCIYDNRIPMLWRAVGETAAWGAGAKGTCPNTFAPHVQDGFRAYKCYNNTFVCCGWGGKEIGNGIAIAVGGDIGYNIGSSWKHEVYNNIFVITGSRDYRSANPNFSSTRGDWIVARYSCVQASAGTQRYDYNIYYRNVPWTPVCGEFVNIQDSKGVNAANYSNLANFKSNNPSSGSGGHYARSQSMYTDGTPGHEYNGREENPNFVNLAGLDYRPRSTHSISGCKPLAGTGWPGTSTARDNLGYRGAINPNGDGSDCGPR